MGRVLVVGGQEGMAGAVILAAAAAFRSGAGLVRIAAARANRDAIHAALPEAIFVAIDDSSALDEAIEHADAIVVGPGLGTGTDAATALGAVCEGRAPLLVDADALNLAASGVVELRSVARHRPVLITPHPGEMARLLGHDDGSALQRTSAAVDAFSAAVLLKGAPSIVGAPDRQTVIDTQSSSDLAVAGMGDTLSGVCGTLLAQGLSPRDAGAVGLYLSGRAARIAALGRGLLPSDVTLALPEAAGERAPETSELDLAFVTFDAEAAR